MSFRLLQLGQNSIANPSTGAQIRNFHLARQLAKTMSVTYLGFQDRHEALAGAGPSREVRMSLIPRERGYTIGKLARGALGSVPITVLNCMSSKMTAALEETLASAPYDIVQIEGVHLYPYLGTIRSAKYRPTYIVCDWHNIESELMYRYSLQTMNPLRRLYARRVASQLRETEHHLLDDCDLHLVTSERERLEILNRRPGSRVKLVENGVDVNRFTPGALTSESMDRRLILFVGSMDYHANIGAVRYFATEVWPALHREVPTAVFTIVGRNPPDKVLELRSRPGVEVTGTVADVLPYYREAFAVVVPLQVAGGTRLKILEAMAAGVPVVSTTLGAEGLGIQSGVHLEIADTPGDFCTRVGELSRNHQRWRQISTAGRKLVEARYHWDIIGSSLAATYMDLLKSR